MEMMMSRLRVVMMSIFHTLWDLFCKVHGFQRQYLIFFAHSIDMLTCLDAKLL